MYSFYDMLPYAQQGGQQDQVMQLIQVYAKMQGIDPKQIMQQLKQMSPQQQQQALQEISQAVQQQQGQQDQMMMYGGGLKKAQVGMQTNNLNPEQFLKSAKKVNTAPVDYINMGKVGNKTLYSKTTKTAPIGELTPATRGTTSDPKQYEQKMIDLVKQGHSPESLAEKGYVSRDYIGKLSAFYTPPMVGTDYLYTEENPPAPQEVTPKPFNYQDEFRGETYYNPDGSARFRGRYKVQPQNTDYYEMYQMDRMGNRTGTFRVPNDVWYNKYTRDNQNKIVSDEGLENYRIPDYKQSGGGIYINPANRGKFTTSAKRAGMGVQEFASHVLANKEDYSPLQVKRANFAHNAAGWNHQYGGVSVGDEMEVSPAQLEYLRQQGIDFDIIG